MCGGGGGGRGGSAGSAGACLPIDLGFRHVVHTSSGVPAALGRAEELKVAPLPRVVRVVGPDGTVLSKGRANVLSLEFAGKWLPLEDVSGEGGGRGGRGRGGGERGTVRDAAPTATGEVSPLVIVGVFLGGRPPSPPRSFP